MDLSGEMEAAGGAGAGTEVPKMDKYKRYYLLHADEKKAKMSARYHSNPEVIRKREERERLKAEKEAAKAAARAAGKLKTKEEREKERIEKLALAVATSKKPKEELAALVGGGLEEFLRRGNSE
jgi:hypothetical protein